jgi:hypothetical protein
LTALKASTFIMMIDASTSKRRTFSNSTLAMSKKAAVGQASEPVGRYQLFELVLGKPATCDVLMRSAAF